MLAPADLGEPAFSSQASMRLLQLHIAEDPPMSDTNAVTGQQVEAVLIASLFGDDGGGRHRAADHS